MIKKLLLIGMVLVFAMNANTIYANADAPEVQEESLMDQWGIDGLVDWTLINPALEEHYWKSVKFYSDDKYKTVVNRLEALLNIAKSDLGKTELGDPEATQLEILIFYVETFALPSVQ